MREDLKGEVTPCRVIFGRESRIIVRRFPNISTRSIQEAQFEDGYVRLRSNFTKAACPNCAACKPSRISVADFKSKLRKRRLYNMNQDLQIRKWREDSNAGMHFSLYKKFMADRFPNRCLEENTFYESFFSKESDNEMWGIYLGSKLICGVIFTTMGQSLGSTLYYYDPDENHRSLGIFATYLLVDEAIKRNKQYVYMGDLTIEPSPYQYKSKLSGIEVLTRDGWQPLRRDVVDQARPADPACK